MYPSFNEDMRLMWGGILTVLGWRGNNLREEKFRNRKKDGDTWLYNSKTTPALDYIIQINLCLFRSPWLGSFYLQLRTFLGDALRGVWYSPVSTHNTSTCMSSTRIPLFLSSLWLKILDFLFPALPAENQYCGYSWKLVLLDALCLILLILLLLLPARQQT